MQATENTKDDLQKRRFDKRQAKRAMDKITEKIRKMGTVLKPSGAKVEWMPSPELRGLLYKMKKIERKMEALEAREKRNKARLWERAKKKHGPEAKEPDFIGCSRERERLIKSAMVTLNKIEKFRGMVERMGGKIDMKEAA
jgi:hypothetical protein